MMNIKYAIEEIKLLGLSRTVYRIWYEITKRMGVRDVSKRIPEVSPDSGVTFDEWKKSHIRPFLKGLEENRYVFSRYFSSSASSFIEEADQALQGRIKCFSGWYADFGIPFNWHYNPKRGTVWPSGVSASSVNRFELECGDIKMPWEPNRFPHLYKVCCAYMLTGDEKYAQFFVDQVNSWTDSNPPMKGVNWHNGQEGAIRLLAWIFALYVFKDSEKLNDDFFQTFLDLLYKHVVFIDSNIDYAKHAVTNNHLIGEALGIYIAGVLFPFMDGLKSLKKRAEKVLFSDACRKQFYSDGGYCQLSFSYQRLALNYYLWCFCIGEANGEDIPYNWMKGIFSRSLELITGCMNQKNGHLPNWGANDGAMLAPWTGADYSDYRPLASALSYASRGRKLFDGNADEELFWLFGADAAESESGVLPTETYFPFTGIKVLRQSPADFIFFRCGTPADRFGQADQNSIVLFAGGEEIVVDGGSYMYNDELAYHRYFMGSKSHNTVTVNGHDQMLLYRRFKWLYPPDAQITEESETSVSGVHKGYSRIFKGLEHLRRIEIIGRKVIIKDTVSRTEQKKKISLHWHVADFNYKEQVTEEGFRYTFNTASGQSVNMTVYSDSVAEVSAVRGYAEGDDVRGWYSRYYGEKKECLDLRFEIESQHEVNIYTEFHIV